MARTNYVAGSTVTAADLNTIGAEVNTVTTGAATTLHSLLEQSPAPSVTTQATSQTKAVGETATFTSAATTLPGPYPARPAVGRVLFQGINHPGELLLPGDIAFSYPAPVPTVQWQSRVSPADWVNILGATAPSYTTPPLTTSENGRQYRPLWNNLFGSTPGAAAVLTVTGTGGGAGTVQLSDSFNRADSTTTLGSTDGGTLSLRAWVMYGAATYGIAGNTAYNATGGEGVAAVETSDADVTITVPLTVGVSAANPDMAVVFRLVDASNFLYAQVNGGGLQVGKKVGNIFANLGSPYSFTPVDGTIYTVKVVTVGSSIEVFLDGVSRVAFNDTTHQTATKHGLRLFESTDRADSFEVI